MNQNLTGPAISFVIEQRSSQKTAPLHFIQLSMCVSHDEHFKKNIFVTKRIPHEKRRSSLSRFYPSVSYIYWGDIFVVLAIFWIKPWYFCNARRVPIIEGKIQKMLEPGKYNTLRGRDVIKWETYNYKRNHVMSHFLTIETRQYQRQFCAVSCGF